MRFDVLRYGPVVNAAAVVIAIAVLAVVGWLIVEQTRLSRTTTALAQRLDRLEASGGGGGGGGSSGTTVGGLSALTRRVDRLTATLATNYGQISADVQTLKGQVAKLQVDAGGGGSGGGNGNNSPPPNSTTTANLSRRLARVEQTVSELGGSSRDLVDTVATAGAKLDGLEGRVATVEAEQPGLEARVRQQSLRVDDLGGQVSELDNRANDLETRQRSIRSSYDRQLRLLDRTATMRLGYVDDSARFLRQTGPDRSLDDFVKRVEGAGLFNAYDVVVCNRATLAHDADGLNVAGRVVDGCLIGAVGNAGNKLAVVVSRELASKWGGDGGTMTVTLNEGSVYDPTPHVYAVRLRVDRIGFAVIALMPASPSSPDLYNESGRDRLLAGLRLTQSEPGSLVVVAQPLTADARAGLRDDGGGGGGGLPDEYALQPTIDRTGDDRMAVFWRDRLRRCSVYQAGELQKLSGVDVSEPTLFTVEMTGPVQFRDYVSPPN